MRHLAPPYSLHTVLLKVESCNFVWWQSQDRLEGSLGAVWRVRAERQGRSLRSPKLNTKLV
jgi:hypothetical protein